jgi:hypothetical protein
VEGWRLVDDRSFDPRLFLEGLIKGGGREGGRVEEHQQTVLVDPEAQVSCP